jgi:hypothetical protein
MDSTPLSITHNHSQTSVYRDVTAVPLKHAGQSSSRRNALRNRETTPAVGVEEKIDQREAENPEEEVVGAGD